ncbi:MAG: putative porin [Verrucomicrobiae bacterium]|nr:putative porin [Verrucomicrobiae bacterium]
MNQVQRWRWFRAVCLGLMLVGAGQAHGQAVDALLEMLVRKGIITDREVKELKEQVDADLARAMNRANKNKVAGWIDEMRWSGDVRLRAEFFDNEDQSNQADRWRFRYRLRLGVEAKFVEWATVGLRLASGGTDDPVSTNETLDDMFQRDVIGIDLAYARIQPPKADWITVTGGKMINPMWQPSFNSPLVYDGDVTPEGLAEQFVWRFGPDQRHALFLNAGQFVASEIIRSADGDGFAFDVQGGGEFKVGRDPKAPWLRTRLAAGFFWTHNIDTNSLTTRSPNLGNMVRVFGTTTNFLADFEVVSVRGDVAWELQRQPFFGTPAIVTVSGEYVKNLADAYESLRGAVTNVSPDQTEGWTVQVAFGEAKKKGQWQVAYQYKYLEADAVLDSWTDSDWGTGGTDREGHVVKAAYNFQDWWQVGLTAFITEKISNRPDSGHNISAPRRGEDLLRLQLDTLFRF